MTDAWLSSLPVYDISKSMMTWMCAYDVPCGRACCFSSNCGSIGCSGCGELLTRLPMPDRFQCMECPVGDPNALFDPRPEFCASCFHSPGVLHHHTQFLQVDGRGRHSGVVRTVGVGIQTALTEADLPVVPLSALSTPGVDQECRICCDVFSEEEPPTSEVGCVHGHADASLNPRTLGLTLNNCYMHAPCRLQGYVGRNLHLFCAPLDPAAPRSLPLLCDVCRRDQELLVWRRSFQVPHLPIALG